MRHRAVSHPEAALASAVDSAPLPGRPRTLRERLADMGVPPEHLSEAEGLLFSEGYRFAGEVIRRLLLSLGQSPAGVALQRALLGDGGSSLRDDAAALGIDAKNLHRAEQRVRRRVARAAQKADHTRPGGIHPNT